MYETFKEALVDENYETALHHWNILDFDQKKIWFNQLFVDCLKESQHGAVEVRSVHPNQKVKIMQMNKEAHTLLPLFYFASLHLHYESNEPFLPYFFEQLINYVLVPLQHDSELTIQTQTSKWNTSIILIEIYRFLWSVTIDLNTIPWSIFNAAMDIMLHPEIAEGAVSLFNLILQVHIIFAFVFCTHTTILIPAKRSLTNACKFFA